MLPSSNQLGCVSYKDVKLEHNQPGVPSITFYESTIGKMKTYFEKAKDTVLGCYRKYLYLPFVVYFEDRFLPLKSPTVVGEYDRFFVVIDRVNKVVYYASDAVDLIEFMKNEWFPTSRYARSYPPNYFKFYPVYSEEYTHMEEISNGYPLAEKVPLATPNEKKVTRVFFNTYSYDLLIHTQSTDVTYFVTNLESQEEKDTYLSELTALLVESNYDYAPKLCRLL